MTFLLSLAGFLLGAIVVAIIIMLIFIFSELIERRGKK